MLAGMRAGERGRTKMLRQQLALILSYLLPLLPEQCHLRK